MTTGILEGAGLMGGVSIATLILTKIKRYYEQRGFGCVALQMNLLSTMMKQKWKQLLLTMLLYSMYLRNIMKIQNKHKLFCTMYVLKC